MDSSIIYTISLHDALPICLYAKGKTSVTDLASTRDHTERMLRYFFVRTTRSEKGAITIFGDQVPESRDFHIPGEDRKSTRLNSSHVEISYAVFCLKKKKTK